MSAVIQPEVLRAQILTSLFLIDAHVARLNATPELGIALADIYIGFAGVLLALSFRLILRRYGHFGECTSC